MSIFKRRSILRRSVVSGSFLLVLAAGALFGCSKEPYGVNSAAVGTAAKEAKTETAKADETKTLAGDPVAGKVIYSKYCHFCHGSKAMGDGPVGIAIKPRPADLIHDKSRVLKSDAQLFYSISEGIRRPGGEEMVMPRWKDVLTEKQRWDVLAYIRQLEKEYGGKDSPEKEGASR